LTEESNMAAFFVSTFCAEESFRPKTFCAEESFYLKTFCAEESFHLKTQPNQLTFCSLLNKLILIKFLC
jgi:hypothetical protein